MKRALLLVVLAMGAAQASDFGSGYFRAGGGVHGSFGGHAPPVMRQPDWGTLPTPIAIAHRGSGNISAPENTIAAFDLAASYNLPLEFDVQATPDGALIVGHDSDWSRMTDGGVTTAVNALSSESALRIDVSQGFRPDLFSPQHPPLFEEMLRRYGGRLPLMPEVKDTLNSTATKMAQLIVRYGLQKSTLVQSFSQPNLDAVKAVDPSIRTILVGASGPSVSAAAAAGDWAVFVGTANITSSYVTNAHAAGLKVFGWDYDHATTVEGDLADGADGYASNDPGLTQIIGPNYTPRGTHTVGVPPDGGLVGSGYRPGSPFGAWTAAVSGGVVTFTGVSPLGDSDYSHLFVPGIRLSAALATTQTITVDLKYVQGPDSAVTTRYVGVKFCWDGDTDGNISGSNHQANGYYFLLRQSGSYELDSVTNGSATVIASGGAAAWATVATGTTVPLRIELTASSITISRTDNSDTVSVADSAHARTGMLAVFGSGVVPGLGSVTVTY